jgi:starvation-inducible DNA-binding protein
MMNATRNTLSQATRKKAVQVLNNTVADLFDLYARIKQAHWNLRGQSFFALHKLLDEFAATTQKHIDLAAERATALGGIVEGTLRDTVKHSRLKKKEEPASKSGQRDWIHELAGVHAACGEHVRSAIKKVTDEEDFGTADLLTDVLRDLDKQLWILEAHLERNDASSNATTTNHRSLCYTRSHSS